MCDPTAIQPIYELVQAQIDSEAAECATKQVVMRSKEACPTFSLGSLWKFSNEYSLLVGLEMIAIGVYLTVFGGKYEGATLFMVGQTLASIVLLAATFITFFPERQEMWVVWLILLLSLALGSGAGYATKRWGKYGVLALGLWLGGIIGSLLFSGLFRLISEDYETLILILSVVSFATLFAVLSQIYFNIAIIVGSAALGSFFLLRVSSNY